MRQKLENYPEQLFVVEKMSMQVLYLDGILVADVLWGQTGRVKDLVMCGWWKVECGILNIVRAIHLHINSEDISSWYSSDHDHIFSIICFHQHSSILYNTYV